MMFIYRHICQLIHPRPNEVGIEFIICFLALLEKLGPLLKVMPPPAILSVRLLLFLLTMPL